MLNNIKLLSGEKLLEVKVGYNKEKLYVFENNIIKTSKELTRKSKILIQCSISKRWIERTFNEKFLTKKLYVSPSASVSGIRNGMYRKQSHLKGKHHTEETKEKLRNKRKGQKHTEETRKLLSALNKGENNKFFGKHHSEETRKLLSELNKGKYDGNNNPFYGKHHSEETKEKLRNKSIEWRKNNPELAKQISLKGAKESMKTVRPFNKMTKPEKIVEEYFKENNIDYIYSFVLGYKYQYDFKIGKWLIEVNGDYWHGNPLIYGNNQKPLNEMQLFKQQKDVLKKQYAEENGYELITIWETDIKNNNFKNQLNEVFGKS